MPVCYEHRYGLALRQNREVSSISLFLSAVGAISWLALIPKPVALDDGPVFHSHLARVYAAAIKHFSKRDRSGVRHPILSLCGTCGLSARASGLPSCFRRKDTLYHGTVGSKDARMYPTSPIHTLVRHFRTETHKIQT